VQAEASLRSFTQTLTRTFAHLPIGLAVFDGARQLALFNPALTDLTGLAPDFLSARPTLTGFLDALRERAMLPEPKDYVAWRRTFADLEQAAAGGLFEETWSLPGGQTYRVTGRPHPNGGLALLIEDISTEMTRTRRYRADLELGQAVIDAMEEAVAVFSAAGQLVMSNAAYADLWGHDPASTLGGDTGIAAIGEHWRSRSAPTTLWDRAEDYVAAAHDEEAWTDSTRLADGRALHCRFAHLAGGATLAAFRVLAEAPAAARGRPRQRDKLAEAAPAPAGAAAS
jgi:PAS domain-containing protein